MPTANSTGIGILPLLTPLLTLCQRYPADVKQFLPNTAYTAFSMLLSFSTSTSSTGLASINAHIDDFLTEGSSNLANTKVEQTKLSNSIMTLAKKLIAFATFLPPK